MTLSKVNYNKYDIYILLLIVSTIFGLIGGALTVPRILAIILIPKLFGIVNREKHTHISSLKFWAIAFYLFAIVSLLWTPDIIEGLKELCYYLIHFFLFFEVIVFARKANYPLQAIAIGFVSCVFLTSIVGFWELTTDNHLAYSKLSEAELSNMGGEVIVRNFASVTFYNSNGYVTYLCFCLPFLLYGFSLEEKYTKVLSIIAIIIAIILILSNASRGGMLSVVICLTLFFLMSPKNKSMLLSFIVLFCGLFYLLYKYGDVILFVLSMRLANGGATSDDARSVIWTNSLKVLFDYCGIGCGIGGMSEAMKEFAKGGVTVTHNIFLEVLCQYGVVFCIAFVVFLYKQFKKGRKSLDIKRRVLVTVALVSFPMTCIINSGYLLDPHLYIVLASIYVFANYERIKPVY